MINTPQLEADFFSRLDTPFTGETIFDRIDDIAYFVKNCRSEYVVVNRTLVERCGLKEKRELIGRRADELFPAPLGASYRAQDEAVLRNGRAFLNQLELHFYPSGSRGWCLTNKLPLRDSQGRVIGLVGISRDLQSASHGGDDYSAVARVVSHIQKHYFEKLRISTLARHAGLSAFQLDQRIRKIFQITAGQFIQKTRMEAAIQRLRESDDSIAEVALNCGYNDQSAFTRQFRQTVGFSPSVYRALYSRDQSPVLRRSKTKHGRD